MRATLALALVFIAGAVGASMFSVTSSGNVFTVARDDASELKHVSCRTVSRSAVQGIHFVPVETNMTFDVGETSKTVRVGEMASSSVILRHRYQAGTFREYGFEVQDSDGTVLAETTRRITYGTAYRFANNFTSASVEDLAYFSIASLDVASTTFASSVATGKYWDEKHTQSQGTWINVTDDGYDQAVRTVSTSNFFSRIGGPREYLAALDYKLYATICFEERDVNEGYHYIQVLTDNASTHDGDDSDDSLKDPKLSLYKAVYESAKDRTLTDGSTLFIFPHRFNWKNREEESNHANELPSYRFSEFGLRDNYLFGHKWRNKSLNAAPTSSSFVLSPAVTNINIRFDAGGKDEDTWQFKDLFVRMALCDAKKPLLGQVFVTQGKNYKYNKVTITLVFEEIVKASDAILHTTWGDFTAQEDTGSYSTAVPFVGNITAEPGTELAFESLEGVILDLNDNACDLLPAPLHLQTALALYKVGTAPAPTIVGGVVQIATATDLYSFSEMVERNPRLSAELTSDLEMLSSAAFPFKSMGGKLGFFGTFDGKGHTIRDFQSIADTLGYKGLFGIIAPGGVVKNVGILDLNVNESARTAFGGICGRNSGLVEGCWFKGAYTGGNMNGASIGAIVGVNEKRGIVRNCAVCDTLLNGANDVIGRNEGTRENAWVLGTADFTSGHACYVVNGGVTDGSQAWYQTLGKDAVPRCLGGTVYMRDGAYVNSLTGGAGLSVPLVPPSTPAYLADADADVLANYAAWGELYGYDLDGVNRAAFLLNMDPSVSVPDDAALLKVVNIGKTESGLHFELASDVAPLTQKSSQRGTSAVCNGYLTLYVYQAPSDSPADGLALGFPVVPAGNGHVSIDIDFATLSPDLSARLSAASTFFRPAVTVEKPASAQ